MRISDWSSDVCSSDLGEDPWRYDLGHEPVDERDAQDRRREECQGDAEQPGADRGLGRRKIVGWHGEGGEPGQEQSARVKDARVAAYAAQHRSQSPGARIDGI